MSLYTFKPQVNMYGLILLLAVFSGLLLILFLLLKQHVRIADIGVFLLSAFLFIFFGAFLFDFINHPNDVINNHNYGFASIGAAMGLLLVAIIFSRLYNQPVYFTSSCISTPLIYSISKLGCVYSGCCYGRPLLHFSRFPVQLTESIIFMIIFIMVMAIYKTYHDQCSIISVILCASAKFVCDYLRYSHINQFLSLNQIVCILFIVVAIIWRKQTNWR